MHKILEQLKSIWFVLAFVVAMTIWYADTNSRITQIEAKQLSQEVALQEIQQLKIQVAVIAENVQFIKEKVK